MANPVRGNVGVSLVDHPPSILQGRLGTYVQALHCPNVYVNDQHLLSSTQLTVLTLVPAKDAGDTKAHGIAREGHTGPIEFLALGVAGWVAPDSL